MATDKVERARRYALVSCCGNCEGECYNSSGSHANVLDELIAAVREDEREQAVARVDALRGPEMREANAVLEGAMEAIRNA